MKLEKWSFSNGSENLIISAIDGPTAWKELTKRVGVKKWHGENEILTPSRWSINCVCDCGKTQSTKFCSESCFIKSKTH